MKKRYFFIFCLLGNIMLFAGDATDYQNHIASGRLLVVFDNSLSVNQKDLIIKNSNLVTSFLHLPQPKLTICFTSNLEAAQNYFSAAAGVTFVSFFITDGKEHYAGVLNDFFVKLTDKSFEPALQDKLKALNLSAAVADNYIPNLYKVINTQFKIHNTIDWCNVLQNETWVAYASPNYLFNPEVSSNDTYYDKEWNIHNTGSNLQGHGTPGADMKVDTAWTLTTGSANIKIGLIDSGTDTLHEDLKANLLPGHDAVGDSTNGYPTPNYPDDGHGTCTAGILAAVKDNGIGIAGVAPSCKVIPVRSFYYEVLSAGDAPIPYSTAAIFADAISWAWDSANADILSNSWGLPAPLIAVLPGGTQPVTDAIETAYINGRNGKGIAMFFSSGNDNDSIGPIWPGSLPQSISVNATNQCDTRKSPTDCSNDAWGGDFGPGLDFSAPGENMSTTDMIGSHGFSGADYYFSFSGTSASCPNAAAVGALVLSINPALGAADVRNIIAQTCDKVGGYGYDSVFANGTWCNELGYGRVNAYRAVQYASTYTAISNVDNRVQLNIFPNPAHDFVSTQYGGNETGIMKIYDLTGHLILEQELHNGLNTTDVSLLQGAVYVVRLDTPTGATTKKLVVCR